MLCEYCSQEHNKSYGTGRFCSSFCAHGFATKTKRKEINQKVSLKLKGRSDYIWIKGKHYHNKFFVCNKCEYCNNAFYSKKIKKYCSTKCENFSLGRLRKPGSGGARLGGGRSIALDFVSRLGEKMKLNKEEIAVAKILDELNFNWHRNWQGFIYQTAEGHYRKYYPDFYLNDYDVYLEYKGWVTEKMNHKMNDSKKRNSFKLLIVYSNDKRYKDLGLNIKQIQLEKQLLLDCVKSLAGKTPVSKTDENVNLTAGSTPV